MRRIRRATSVVVPVLGILAGLASCSSPRAHSAPPTTQAVDSPSAEVVANAVNLHQSDLPGWSFVDDGLLDNTSKGGILSGAGPHGYQSPQNQQIVAVGIDAFAKCMDITPKLSYEWLGITSPTDLIARVHTGDFFSPDKSVAISSETGIALSEADAVYDEQPFLRPQLGPCLERYFVQIAPAVSAASAAFGQPGSITLTDVSPLPIGAPPTGISATGFIMTFTRVPTGATGTPPASATPSIERASAAYVTAGRIEIMALTYATNVIFPADQENQIVSGIEERVLQFENVTFRSTQVVHSVTTGSPDTTVPPPQ